MGLPLSLPLPAAVAPLCRVRMSPRRPAGGRAWSSPRCSSAVRRHQGAPRAPPVPSPGAGRGTPPCAVAPQHRGPVLVPCCRDSGSRTQGRAATAVHSRRSPRAADTAPAGSARASLVPLLAGKASQLERSGRPRPVVGTGPRTFRGDAEGVQGQTSRECAGPVLGAPLVPPGS